MVEFLQIQIPIDRTSETRTRATQMLTDKCVEMCSTPLTTAPRRIASVVDPKINIQHNKMLKEKLFLEKKCEAKIGVIVYLDWFIYEGITGNYRDLRQMYSDEQEFSMRIKRFMAANLTSAGTASRMTASCFVMAFSIKLKSSPYVSSTSSSERSSSNKVSSTPTSSQCFNQSLKQRIFFWFL